MTARAGAAPKIAVLAVGLVCLVAAAVLAGIVVPTQARLPADTDETRRLAGTAAVLLNPAALAAGDVGNVLLADTPVTVDQRTRVTDTDGDVARVATTRHLRTADGQDIAVTEAAYAVDRTSMREADPPSGWEVADHEGITVSWPPGAEKRDYPGWVPDTQATTTLRYARTEDRAGLATYVYEANVPAGRITNPGVLANLPTELAPSALAGLVGELPLPAEVRALVTQAIPLLEAAVPVIYSYEATTTYWVEPVTGIIVDAETREVRKAGLELPGGATVPPTFTVFDVSVGFAEATTDEAASDAKDAGGALRTFGVVLPGLLLVVGVLAIVGCLLWWLLTRSGPRSSPASEAAP